MYRSSVWRRFLNILSSSMKTGSKYPRGSDSYSIQRSSMFLALWLVAVKSEINRWTLRCDELLRKMFLNYVVVVRAEFETSYVVTGSKTAGWMRNERVNTLLYAHKCSSLSLKTSERAWEWVSDRMRLPIPLRPLSAISPLFSLFLNSPYATALEKFTEVRSLTSIQTGMNGQVPLE